jgi:hypothetical protein
VPLAAAETFKTTVKVPVFDWPTRDVADGETM